MITCNSCEREIGQDEEFEFASIMDWNYGAALCMRCAVLLGRGREE